MSELNSHRPQNQEPKNNHQRQIKSAKAGSILRRESKIKCSACRQEPHLISIPDRTARPNSNTSLRFVAPDEKTHNTCIQIKPVQYDVNRNHECNNRKPNSFHFVCISFELMNGCPAGISA